MDLLPKCPVAWTSTGKAVLAKPLAVHGSIKRLNCRRRANIAITRLPYTQKQAKVTKTHVAIPGQSCRHARLSHS